MTAAVDTMDEPDPPRSARRARPYTLTAGRTRPLIDLPLEATVEAVPAATADELDAASAAIVGLCAVRQSIAEVSSYTDMPIGVVRVLVADLVDSGRLRVYATLTDLSTVAEQRRMIERTLDGLRAL
jgi:hypothetical protein